MKKNFPYKKSLGQNFLHDPNVLGYISSLCSDKVLEIGAGQGALTRYLVKKCHKVVAIEIDHCCSASLNQIRSEYNNFEWHLLSALKFDWQQVPNNLTTIVGNLPYNIATRIVLDICRYKKMHCVFMVQEELAKRMIATVSTSFYCALSVIIQTYYKIKIHKKIPPQCFYPSPKVWSRIIELQPKQTDIEFSRLSHVLDVAFVCRRKMIRNTILSRYPSLGLLLKATDRAQDISMDFYHRVASMIPNRMSTK